MNKFREFFFDERKVCLILCSGILYTLFLWPLLNSILCISLTAYWVLFCKKKFDVKKTSSRLVLIFAGLYLPYVTGMFYTTNLQEGYFRLSEHMALALFPLVFGCSRFLDKSMVRLLLTHFIISCLIVSISGLIFGLLPAGVILPDALHGGNQYLFGDTYPYMIGLGCLLSLMSICENLYDQRILRKGFIIFVSVFLSFYLLFLNVRLVSFCWFAGMLYFIVSRIQASTYRFLISCIIILLLVFGMYKIPMMRSKWDELRTYKEQMIPLDRDASLGKSWGGTSIRIAIWKCGLDLIERHPLIGVGTGDVQDSLQQEYENRKFYFASRYNHYNLHNQYLQTLAGFGLFGFIILLACIVAPAVCLKSGAFYRIRLIFLCMFFLICFTEVILDTNKGIIWYSFFNSIFAFGAGEARE
jgi:O-antigen ligase